MQKRSVIRGAVFLIVTAGIGAAAYTYREYVPSDRAGIVDLARKAKGWFLAEKAKTALPGSEGQNTSPGVQPGGHEGHGSGEPRVAYWYDPMHPDYRSDQPGTAPDCGMKLVPMYAEQLESMAQMAPGTVMLTPDKQQLIGVRTARVEVADLTRAIRTVGRIEADETRITRVQTKFEGWIDKVYVDFVGKLVRKGQPLFTIYSPELVSTQQEYLIALRGRKLFANTMYREVVGSSDALLQSARQRLKLWDISDDQIDQLEQTGETTRAMTLNSPVDGYVTTRNVYENTFVNPDKELYTIVDLSTVWVNLDIYEDEAAYLQLGQTAEMTLQYTEAKSYAGTVSYIYPTLDMNARTLKARLEFQNSSLELKPGMYAGIALKIDVGRKLQVPAEAVLDSGIRKIVFLAKPGGYFEPREIEVGSKLDRRFIVNRGLQAGDLIVTSGNFLLDSESRLSSGAPVHAHGTEKK